MKLILLVLGVLSLAYKGECALTWATPPSKDDNGIVKAIDQEDSTTADIYSFTLTAVTSISITSQTPASVFATTVTVATNAGPLRLATGQSVDYTAATSHVIVLEATDSATTTTETATMTLLVRMVGFLAPLQCVDLTSCYAATTTLATALAIGGATTTQVQVGTTTGYSLNTGNGVITNDAIITTATTAAQVTVYTTGVEAYGTTTTATATIHLCINGGCTCSSVFSGGASFVTAGLLSIIMVLILKLK